MTKEETAGILLGRTKLPQEQTMEFVQNMIEYYGPKNLSFQDKQIKKVIIVPGKLVNIVTK